MPAASFAAGSLPCRPGCAPFRADPASFGALLRSQGGKKHLNNGKTRARKRNLRGLAVVASEKVTKTMQRMLQGN